jgi:hypothetical protein
MNSWLSHCAKKKKHWYNSQNTMLHVFLFRS